MPGGLVAERPPQEFDWEAAEAQFEEPALNLPAVINLAEIDAGQLAKQESRRFIADVAMRSSIEYSPPGARIMSLKDGIHKGAKGDPEADAMVETNALTDAYERVMKSGGDIEVELETDENLNIYQHGQPLPLVQANSLKYASNHPSMEKRVKAEVGNSFIFKWALQNGLLEDYTIVVPSLAADDMSKADMKQAGFFVETMSASLQGLTINHNGSLTLESAFVAGIDGAYAPRHDIQAIVAIYKELGVQIEGKSVTEILATPVAIHKSLMPNGMVDFVKWYDQKAGGRFFGQPYEGPPKTTRDYVLHKRECRQHLETFRSKVKSIKAQLYKEAPSILSEVQAARRLNKISGEHMVDKAIDDKMIDPRVFGGKSAGYIIQARQYQNDGYQMAMFRELARESEQSSSCPGSLRRKGFVDLMDGLIIDLSGMDVYGFKKDDKKAAADCEFTSQECPSCHKKDVKTVAKGGKYYGECGCES